jgi:hypothetical protein
MSDSPHLRDRDRRQIETTIHETLDLRHRPIEAARRLLDGLRHLAGTEGPTSILFAGRMGVRPNEKFDYRGRFHHGPLGDDWIRRFDWRLQRGFSPVLTGMRSVRDVNRKSASHAMSRRQLVDDHTWRKSPIFKGDIAPLKITDQLFAWYQTQSFAVNFIIRAVDGHQFDEASRARIRTAIEMMQTNPDLMAVVRPVNAQPQLTPQLVLVRDMLIGGFDYEQIRRRLPSRKGTVTIETVKSHVKKLFRRYGITGGRQDLAREHYRLSGSTDEVLDRTLKDEYPHFTKPDA